METIFPSVGMPEKYYSSHVRYVIESAHAAALTVTVGDAAQALENGRFEVIIDVRTESAPERLCHGQGPAGAAMGQ